MVIIGRKGDCSGRVNMMIGYGLMRISPLRDVLQFGLDYGFNDFAA